MGARMVSPSQVLLCPGWHANMLRNMIPRQRCTQQRHEQAMVAQHTLEAVTPGNLRALSSSQHFFLAGLDAELLAFSPDSSSTPPKRVQPV